MQCTATNRISQSKKAVLLLLFPLAALISATDPLLRDDGFTFSRVSNQVKNWKSLFNGKDFSGWTMHLNKPHSSITLPGLTKDSLGEYKERLGINNDPLKVFTVVNVDGSAAIRVSGQVFGYIVSSDTFSNFRLRLQFKWGQSKWPPRQYEKRDAGVLYYSVGNVGEHKGTWMVSQECQIQEGDCGDFWPIGNTRIDIPSEKTDSLYRYYAKGVLTTFGNGTNAGPRCLKTPDNEYPNGQWNTIEVICFNGNSVHIINGQVVMRLFNSRVMVDNVEEQLISGKIQLQSEGAEIFYRKIEVMPISEMPSAMRDSN